MMVGGTKPFIEVNGQQTRIFNVTTRRPPQGGSFGSYVQVDDDQSFLLDGLDSTLGGQALTCNPTFCGAFVTAPGPFNRWAAVGWLKHLTLSLQCAGKGVEWLSGNGLRISDSVIQGWSVFGVRVSNQRGGYGGFMSRTMCTTRLRPPAKTPARWEMWGTRPILAEGIQVKMSGLANNGGLGRVSQLGRASRVRTTGSTGWFRSTPSSAMASRCPRDMPLTNGSGSITGTFPRDRGSVELQDSQDRLGSRQHPASLSRGHGELSCDHSSAELVCDVGLPVHRQRRNARLPTPMREKISRRICICHRLDFWPGSDRDQSRRRHVDRLVFTTVSRHRCKPMSWASGRSSARFHRGGRRTSQHCLMMIAERLLRPPPNLEALHTNGAGAHPRRDDSESRQRPRPTRMAYKGRLNFGHRGLISASPR